MKNILIISLIVLKSLAMFEEVPHGCDENCQLMESREEVEFWKCNSEQCSQLMEVCQKSEECNKIMWDCGLNDQEKKMACLCHYPLTHNLALCMLTCKGKTHCDMSYKPTKPSDLNSQFRDMFTKATCSMEDM